MSDENTVTTLRLHLIKDVVIDGCGSEVVLKLSGFRVRPRSKRSQYFELELSASRFLIKRLVMAIAEMQVRDRQRIENELNRLVSEVAPVQHKP